jgi:flagellar motor switch protein FliN/FliY
MKIDLDENIEEFETLKDISVNITTDLGQTTLTTGDILKLKEGSIIDLNKPAGESVEIFINNKVIGKGEVMVYEENLAVRINEILDADTIIQYFKKEPKQ